MTATCLGSSYRPHGKSPGEAELASLWQHTGVGLKHRKTQAIKVAEVRSLPSPQP